MSKIIDNKSERVSRLLKSLDRMTNGLENIIRHHRPTLNGERYLTDSEVSERLKVSRRTLQEWRNSGKISYIALGGKCLYPESAIQKLLDSNYHKAWE